MIKIKVRKNPTDKEFLEKIKIKRTLNKYNLYRYDVYFNNKLIVYAFIHSEMNFVSPVEILGEEYKRRGLATYLYDYIEKDLKIKLKPSEAFTSEGKAFWENRLKRKNPTDLNFLKRFPSSKDERDYTIVRNYEDFVNLINTLGLPKYISFDHDLGENETGYDCAKFLVDYCLDNNKKPAFEFYVRSQSPVGKENIKRLLNDFKGLYEKN